MGELPGESGCGAAVTASAFDARKKGVRPCVI
jgi:hypothetical protein